MKYLSNTFVPRSLDTPPESAITLLECVAILKGLRDTTSSWKNLCDMVDDPNFLANLKELDVNKINQRSQTQVRTKVKFLKKTVDAQAVRGAERDLLNFVESVLKYCTIYQDIVPLKHKIDKLERDYLDATLKLREHEDGLKNTRCALSNLEKSLDDVSGENVKLKEANALLKLKFAYADKLMGGLSSVRER